MGLDLKDRKIDEWGNVIFSIDGLLENLMRGNSLGSLVAEATPEVQQFNQLCREFDHIEDAIVPYAEPTVSVEEFDKAHQSEWFTPEPYASLDVLSYLLERCSTDQQVDRVNLEWKLFTERGMEPVLRFLIYMIDNFRERKVLWGVGRGSSVASYCLYLMGVHRIDSLKFDLDPYEFLKK
jgi:DNA polymerase III alpha subunit